MKKLALLSFVVLGTMALTGCQNYQYAAGERQAVGTVLGGIGGGLIGSAIGSGSGQVVATAAGAIIGAIAGNEFGRRMDETDRVEANQAFHQATKCEIGHTTYWSNPPTGHHGSIRPIRDGISSHGLYCREFQTTIFIDGRSERLYGQACRMRDGSWKPV